MEFPKTHVMAAAPLPMSNCLVPEYHQVRVVTKETTAPVIKSPASDTIKEYVKLLKPSMYGRSGTIAPRPKEIKDEIAANLADGKSLVETPNSSRE